MLALFSTGRVGVDSCLLFDDDRDGIVRKDLFFLATSTGPRTVCEGVSLDVAPDWPLFMADSVDDPAGSIGLGACDESGG